MNITKKKAWGIIIKDNQFLVVYRKKLQDFTLPKGHIDEWENPEECAVREVEEETWYNCTIKSFLWDMTYQYTDNNENIIISIVSLYCMDIVWYDETLVHEDEVENVLRFDLTSEWIMKLTNKSDQQFMLQYKDQLLQ